MPLRHLNLPCLGAPLRLEDAASDCGPRDVANLLANFAEVPLLVDLAETEAKCDQRKRDQPEYPIGPIRNHTNYFASVDRLHGAGVNGFSTS